jgi:hypothetical protein
MSSINKPISKSIFKPVHNPLRVPPVLLGGSGGGPSAETAPFTSASIRLLDDGAPYHVGPVDNRYFVRNATGSNHALIKTPCLHGREAVLEYADVGTFALDANFEISCWIKYEGSNTTGNGPMFFGGGGAAGDAAAHIWYRPSTGVWYLAVDGGGYRINAVSNTIIEDNRWHFLQARRVGTTYSILLDGTTIASATGAVTRFTLRRIMQTFSASYSFDGLMADFKVDNAGVVTHFPLQDGEGNGTNRNIAWHRSDNVSGVISNAIVGGAVSDWWAGKSGGHAPDWSIEYGGRIGANGEFILGNITGGNCADGNAKTLAAGKLGNPFSRINMNSGWTDSLMRRAVPTEFIRGQQLNEFVWPFESGFNRNSADGTDRILVFPTEKSGATLDNIRTYTGVTAPTAWTLANLPNETADEYFAAITANSGTISTANQTAVRNLLNGLHAQGLFDDVLVLYLFHGNHLNAARLNAMNPTLFDGSAAIAWTGSPTLNASGGITPSVGNFGVAFHPHWLGLYEFTSFGGAGIGFFSTSNAASSERTIGNITSFYLAPKFSSASEIAISNSTALTGSAQDLSGFHFGTREPASDNIAAYRNGTAYLTGTRSFSQVYTTANDTGRCHIGGCSNSGAGNLASTTPIRLALCTRGLLAAQVATLNTLVQTYISELV